MPNELIALLLGAVLGDAVSTANPTKMLFEALKRLGLWAELEFLLRDEQMSDQLREVLKKEGKIDWKRHPELLDEGPLCAHLMEVYLHNGGKRATIAEKMRMKNMLGKLAPVMLAINNNRPEFERELQKETYTKTAHTEGMTEEVLSLVREQRDELKKLPHWWSREKPPKPSPSSLPRSGKTTPTRHRNTRTKGTP